MKGNFIDIITKKIKKNKSIFSMSLFVLLFSNYKDVLTMYKTVTNTENLVTHKEKPAEIEVKKMRKKFIEI